MYPTPPIQQVLTVDALIFGRNHAVVASRYTEACWQHKQEEAFHVLVRALPLLTCFLPSPHEVQHHVHGVPCCEWFLGKQALLHTHTCLTQVFTEGGLLRVTLSFLAYLPLGFHKALWPLCLPLFKLSKKRLSTCLHRVSSFSLGEFFSNHLPSSFLSSSDPKCLEFNYADMQFSVSVVWWKHGYS